MEGFGFLDIIFFAIVAAFIVLRLRSVLGRRTGHERPPTQGSIFGARPDNVEDNVISLPDRGAAVPGEATVEADGDAAMSDVPAEEGVTAMAGGLGDIKRADPSFDTNEFLAGARVAYEMIVVSFANGDVDTLKPLLAGDVYANFAGAIQDREAREETLETTLVAINSAEVIEARMEGRSAEVTVKFVSESVNVTRDAAGEAVSGDPRAVEKVTDIWTFARDTRGNDPNWRLIATSSPN